MSDINFTAAVCTLGCRVNQYEGDCIISEFINLGFKIKNFDEICDVYVINTCTVTAGSDKKSKQMIRRAKKNNKNAVIAVCGCFSQGNPGIFRTDLYADIVAGTGEKIKIPEIALDILNNNAPKPHFESFERGCPKGGGLRSPNDSYVLVKPIAEYKTYENINAYQSEKTRAYIKIQDGCDCKCSYCIIPQVRGSVKSRGYNYIYDEVKRFNDMNYHEIVLTGIEISSYGKEKDFAGDSDLDVPCENLIGLLEKLNAEPELKNITAIRLSSVDPSLINKNFIDRLANLNKIANHFHVSLQSGSTRILNLMRRKYNIETVIKNIAYAKEKIKDLNITADIIVGFPGETEDDFEKSIEAAKLLNIYHAHIFAYSKRPGTDAADFENQVGENIKNLRSKMLSEVCGKIKEEIHRESLNKEFDVIIEDLSRDGFYTAKTKNFINVKIKIKAGKNQNLRGTLQKIKMINYDRDFLYGEIL